MLVLRRFVDFQAVYGVPFVVLAKVYFAVSASESIDNLCLLVLAEVTVFQYDCFEVGLAL